MGKYRKWLKLFGVALWIYIILQLDFAKIGEVLRLMDIRWLLAASVFLIGMFLLKAFRWQTVINLQGIRYRWTKTMGITFVSSFFGLLVPGKMGDIIKVSYLKDSGLSITRGMVSILLDRFYDLLVLLMFSLFGLAYFAHMFTSQVSEISIILLIVVLGAALVIGLRGRIFSSAKKLLRILVTPSFYDTISQEWSLFKEEFRTVARKTVLPMALLSVLSYLCMFSQFFAVARGLGLTAPFLYLGLSLSLATFVSLLPISIGGLGTREAVFILMLGKISISPEAAVLLSFIDLVVFAVLLPGLFTLPFWLKREE